MAVAIRASGADRESWEHDAHRPSPVIKLCTAAELHRLRYDQLTPTQARRIHSLMQQLGRYAEDMDFPPDFAKLFATMYNIICGHGLLHPD